MTKDRCYIVKRSSPWYKEGWTDVHSGYVTLSSAKTLATIIDSTGIFISMIIKVEDES